MNDLILTERIESLKRDLKWTDTARKWLTDKLQKPRPNELTDDLWDMLSATIRTQAGAQIAKLDKIYKYVDTNARNGIEDEQQAIKQAWRSYAEIYQESRQVFSEYLDVIGGLAMRYNSLDEEICCIADELIKRCSRESIGTPWNSLSVLATQETFTKTLARLIRLRFPEWTIWALPFAAHEYGHVVAADNEDIERFLETEVERVAKDDAEYQAATDKQARERVGRRINKHLNVLFADAFATYTMGPA